jgi:pimeloyl-ACP methyl ester carboxylesterase
MEGTESVYVKANGIMFHCEVAGEGPLCICLHGFPETRYSWRNQVPLLSRKFKVVVPDMRGYGETFAPWAVEDYLLDVLLKDVKGLIEAFGYKEAVLVSHDWGAVIGIHYAEAYPETVSKLVWSDSVHLGDYYNRVVKQKNLMQLLRSWYVLLNFTPSLSSALFSLHDFWVLDKLIGSYAVRKEKLGREAMDPWKGILRRSGLRGGMMYYRANLFRLSDYSPEKLSARLKGKRIQCPVRGVWGDTDRALSRELAHAVKDRIDGPFDLHFIKNCGHWVQQEAPEEYNEQLADFLEIR